MRTLQASHGALLLGRLGRDQAEIARDLGKSRSLVGHWRNGFRVPVMADRLELRRLYGIPLESWDVPPPPPGEPSAPPSPDDPMQASTARELAADLAKQARRLMTRIQTDKVDPRTEAAVLTACKQSIELLQRCELDEEKIIRSPQWAKIRAAIVESLRPYPDAADAVREALRGLRVEASG